MVSMTMVATSMMIAMIMMVTIRNNDDDGGDNNDDNDGDLIMIIRVMVTTIRVMVTVTTTRLVVIDNVSWGRGANNVSGNGNCDNERGRENDYPIMLLSNLTLLPILEIQGINKTK